MKLKINIPEEIKKDLSTATEILLREGCKKIYIFGSLVEGSFTENSDLDIAIVGLKKNKFFKVYGELLEKLNRSVDLVGLDYKTNFSKMILKSGKITRVA